jgi:TRAP transporter TAXI family solute receptor
MAVAFETGSVRRWLAWAMLAVLVGSLGVWNLTRERLPATVRIATGAEGGLYHHVGRVLAVEFQRRTGRRVELIATEGSVENRQLLLRGGADLAILQLGTVEKAGIAALSPLYREVIHVVVRRGRGIASPRDLDGRAVILGLERSGMRRSANEIIEHYRIRPIPKSDSGAYFTQLAESPEMDAAIVTTGLLNPDLTRLLISGEFELIPILDAAALAVRHSHLSAVEIPRGLYNGRPPLPPQPVLTVATTNFLAAPEGASPLLVNETLRSLHESYLQSEIPGLLPRQQAASWSELSLHPAARAYYDPYQGLGLLANFMETLSAVKELLFALGAGLYLGWSWWRELARREQRAQFRLQKERLDDFLDQTVAIEEAQMKATDGSELRYCLDEVTRIKLEAISELTNEEVRGDRMFSIFLSQCSSVSRKIEAKLTATATGHPFASSPDGGITGLVRAGDSSTRDEPG